MRLLPSSVDELWQSFWGYWYDWIVMRYLGRRYIQLLLDSCPILPYHQDQTITDHTWVPHVELLEFFWVLWYYLGFRWRVRGHHEGKRIDFQQRLWVVDNQIIKLGISRHLNYHTFYNINHKIHKLEWFVWISDFLWEWWSYPCIALSEQSAMWLFPHYDGLYSWWFNTSINIISHEQIIGIRYMPTYFE